jgi:mannose-1-phosphate guanylyltransferase/mannose-1-phosphate guanylyltransferase/mannose-6-phosphate isomerase
MTSPAGIAAAAVGKRILPVILSGGGGTRLWPLSRPACPKQFLPLIDARSMLQLTAARVGDRSLFAPPIVVGSAAQADLIERQLADAHSSPASLILEPCGRNTAPAIALAALVAPPDSLLLVMPSDHHIQYPDLFRQAVAAGAAAARGDWLVTFGIRPDRPETGYGYIRRGEAIGPGVFRADRFVEKPDAATAVAYLTDGSYDWNGGIFLFRAAALLNELAEHAPDILAVAQAALRDTGVEQRRVQPNAEAFASAPSQSIDRAVMERSRRVAVVPVDMGWSDVGSWDSLHTVASQDSDGNALQGAATAIETRNCLLHTDGPRLVTVGVEDLIVVVSGDAVLVMRRGESQRVGAIAAALEGGSS